MKVWKVEYQGNNIRVENSWKGERLFVNDELQDEQVGAFATRARLFGKLINENDEIEHIKVSIGGSFSVVCRIFVNDSLLSTI